MVLFKMPDLKELANMQDELVLPFMWAEDGFGEPSEKMAEAIRSGDCFQFFACHSKLSYYDELQLP